MLISDLETDGLMEDVSVIHCVHLFDTEEPEKGVQRFNDHDYKSSGTIAEGVAKLGSAKELLFHNGIDYDFRVLDKLYPTWDKGVKRLDSLVMTNVIWTELKQIDFACRDSGAWSMLGERNAFPEKFSGKRGRPLYGSHSLEAWGHRLGLHKDDFDPANYTNPETGEPHTWKSIGWTEDMDDYCVRDVEVTAKLWQLIDSKQYSQQCFDLEHSFATIISRQVAYGFKFNVQKAEALQQRLMLRRAELEEELRAVFQPWYTPDGKSNIKPEYSSVDGGDDYVCTNRHELARGYRKPQVKNGPRNETAGAPFTKLKHITFNPASTDHIGQRLQAVYDWRPNLFGKDGKPTCDDDVLSTLQFDCIPAIREYLVISKRLGMLAEGKQALLKKVSSDGRMHGRVQTNGAGTGRCTHSGPNVAQTPACGKPYGKEFRELYEAAPGYKIIGADASGLELRMLGHFMAAYDGGEYANEVVNGDAHWVNLRAIGVADCERDKANQKHTDGRNGGKTWVYSNIYGGGVPLLGLNYMKAYQAFHGKTPKGTAIGLGRKSKKAFRDNLPALGKLEDAVKAKAQKTGTLKGLDGRIMASRSPHSALNQILQGGGALVMKKALCILDDMLQQFGAVAGYDYEFVANVHDEWQVEVRDAERAGIWLPQLVADKSCEAMEGAGEYFNLRCKIEGEADIGNNWAETH